MAKQPISTQSHTQATAIANGTKKAGQTKEQTKLIAAGIEKGIAHYKKQHKAKMREQDKQRKKSKNISTPSDEVPSTEPAIPLKQQTTNHLPWVLLIASWLGFVGYFFVS